MERAGLVTTDSIEQARMESGDLVLAAEEGKFDWGRAVELGAVAAGRARG